MIFAKTLGKRDRQSYCVAWRKSRTSFETSRKHVIVGAHSLAFHGRPRYTGDLDILIRPTPENAAKLIEILNHFGFADAGFKELSLTS